MSWRTVAIQLKHSSRRFRRPLVTFFVALSLLLSNFAVASENDFDKNLKIQQAYRDCLEVELSNADLAEIKDFRRRFNREVPRFEFVAGQTTQTQIDEYMKAVDQIIPQKLSAKMQPRFLMVMAERSINEIVSESLTLRNTSYQNYMALVREAMLEQKPIDLDRLAKLHHDLLSELASYYMNESDKALGLTVPLSLKMSEPQKLRSLILAVNLMSENVASIQLENTRISGDRWASKKAFAWQTTYGVLGTGAIIGTLFIGGPLVAKGGSVALTMGLKSFFGKAAAGQAIGGFGGGGLMLGIDSSISIASATWKSYTRGTPFRCEFDRSYAESEGALVAGKHGVIAGVVAGTIGSAAVGGNATISRWVMAASAFMIRAGAAYEVGYTYYDAVKLIENIRVTAEMKNLKEIPATAKDIHQALIQSLQAESDLILADMVKHGMNAAAIVALWYYWFPHGEYADAVRQGVSRAIQVMAPSADTIPSVAHAGLDFAATGITSVRAAVKGPSITESRNVIEEARRFLTQVSRSNTTAAPAAIEPVNWKIQRPR